MQQAIALVPLGSRAKESPYGDTFAESWYAVMPSKSLRKGELKPFAAFNDEWVLARTESGVVQAMSRFCPHMGAPLHTGFVKGERVVCPFHHWQFEEGVCKAIPYLPEGGKIPPRARLRMLPTREHLGFIWVYNGASPSHEMPDMPEASDPKFGWRSKSRVFDMHHLLVLENGCDPQHFKTIHKVDFLSYRVDMLQDEKHALGFHIRKKLRSRFLGEYELTNTIEFVGASMIYGTVLFNNKIISRFISAPLPIHARSTLYNLIVLPRKLPVPIPGLNSLYLSVFMRMMFWGALQDYKPIWSQMDPTRGGAMVEEDALQLKFRRYHRAHLPSGE